MSLAFASLENHRNEPLTIELRCTNQLLMLSTTLLCSNSDLRLGCLLSELDRAQLWSDSLSIPLRNRNDNNDAYLTSTNFIYSCVVSERSVTTLFIPRKLPVFGMKCSWETAHHDTTISLVSLGGPFLRSVP